MMTPEQKAAAQNISKRLRTLADEVEAATETSDAVALLTRFVGTMLNHAPSFAGSVFAFIGGLRGEKRN